MKLPRQAQERLFAIFFVLTDGISLDSSFALMRNTVIWQLLELVQVLRVMGSHRYGWTDDSVEILRSTDVVYLISKFIADVIPRYSFLLLAAGLVAATAGTAYYINSALKIGALSRKWPVKLLRALFGILVTVLYVSILNWLMMPVECIASKESETISSVIHNEDSRCTPWSMPDVLISIPSIIAAVAFYLLADYVVVLSSEVNPLSRHPMAMHTGRVEAQYLSLKTSVSVLVLFSSLITPVVVALVILFLAYQLFNKHTAMLPFCRKTTNNLRGGTLGAVLWMALSSSVVAIFKTSAGDDWESEMPSYMQALQYGLIGFLPLAIVLGIAYTVYVQTRIDKSLNRLRGDWQRAEQTEGLLSGNRDSKVRPTSSASQDGAGGAAAPRRRGAWERFFDVEWESRRRFASEYRAMVLVRTLLRKRSRSDIPLMHFIMRKAMEEHPESKLLPLLLLVLNRFVFMDGVETAALQKKLSLQKKDLPLDHQFLLFMGERRGAEGMAGEGGGGVHLLEFEACMARARHAHLGCISKMREFWRFMRKRRTDALDELQAEDLVSMLEEHDKMQRVATNEYTALLDKFPQSVQLLRSYAHFYDNVLNDFKEAEKRISQAALLDGEDEEDDDDEGSGKKGDKKRTEQLELFDARSASSAEGESYRTQVYRYFTSQRDAIMGDELAAVRSLHRKVRLMLVVVLCLATAGFCVTDLYLFRDILVRNIDLIDKTGLFRAYAVSSNFLLRSSFLAAHGNNTEGWTRFTGLCKGAMETLRAQHFLNYDDIPSKRISNWYHHSEISYDLPVENGWERRSDHYWNVANDFARRVSRAAETPMGELSEPSFVVGEMSEAKAQVAYAFENTQTSAIPMFETMVKLYEDEVFSFGQFTTGLIAANAAVNSVIVLMMAFFILNTLRRVINNLHSKYILCKLGLALPRHVATALYKHYDALELDMKIVDDEQAERKAILRGGSEEEDDENGMEMRELNYGGGELDPYADPAWGSVNITGQHFGRTSSSDQPAAGGVGALAAELGLERGGGSVESAGSAGEGVEKGKSWRRRLRGGPKDGRGSRKNSVTGSESGESHTSHSEDDLREVSEETQLVLGKAIKAREAWCVRREVYWVALAMLLGMCILSMVYPARRIKPLVNFAPTQNQAGRRRYLTRSCAHFTRELVLNDGFSRLTKSQLSSALRYHLKELQDADKAVRMGGVNNVQIGADFRNEAHNVLMYGLGCPWREDPEDCSLGDHAGRGDTTRNGLAYLLVSYYDAVETVLARYGEPAESFSMDFRTHEALADVSEFADITPDPARLALLTSDKDVKFVIAAFAGDVFNGLGSVLTLFTAEIAEVLSATKFENRLLFGLYAASIAVVFYACLFARTIRVCVQEVHRARLYVMMLPAHVLKGKDVHAIMAYFNPKADEEEEGEGGNEPTLG